MLKFIQTTFRGTSQAIVPLALVILVGCASDSSPISEPDEPTPTQASPSSVKSPPEADADHEPRLSDMLSDTLVLPGQRVGPITPETSRDDLAARFGEERLTDEEVHVGEGFTEPGTRVDLGPDYSFSIIWMDESRSRPLEIRDLGSAWKTPQGIGVGTSFSRLQRALGDFELYGFAWDYGGTVVLDDTELDPYDEFLVLRVQPEENAMSQHSDDYEAVMGDALYASSNPHFQPLDLFVYDMIVRLSPPDTQ